mmetsp:Transcript_4924/g.14956  ORF Transcript_4924/g.14956 Transcript_4924/m.14956 type:complete len:270 (+) Transcript_4924:230-1039(+)
MQSLGTVDDDAPQVTAASAAVGAGAGPSPASRERAASSACDESSNIQQQQQQQRERPEDQQKEQQQQWQKQARHHQLEQRALALLLSMTLSSAAGSAITPNAASTIPVDWHARCINRHFATRSTVGGSSVGSQPSRALDIQPTAWPASIGMKKTYAWMTAEESPTSRPYTAARSLQQRRVNLSRVATENSGYADDVAARIALPRCGGASPAASLASSMTPSSSDTSSGRHPKQRAHCARSCATARRSAGPHAPLSVEPHSSHPRSCSTF